MWKVFFAAVILSGCGNQIIQKWSGKIYSYQVNDLSFERTQDNEKIKYNDPKTQGFFCMSPQDFMDFLNSYVVGSQSQPPKIQSPKASGQ